MSLRDLSVVLGLLATVATGCVSSDDDGDSGPNYPHPSETAFCKALAQAQCSSATVNGCYASSDDTLADDTASCVAKRSDLAVCRLSVTGGVAIGSPTYNPQVDTTGCINSHGSVFSDAALELDELATAREACIQVFSGPGGNGAECGNDYDCDTTSELRCIVKPGAESGKCAVPVEVAGGEECSAADATCGEDFFCDADSVSCLKAKSVDKPCAAATPCLSNLLCVIAAGDEEGVCEAKAANNDPCTSGASCAGGFCNVASGADAGKCAAKQPLTQTSTSCDAF